MELPQIDLDKLYTRYLLRDFLGKIIPGLIVLSSIIVLFTSLDYFLSYIISISLRDEIIIFVIIIFGISWIMALAIQAFGETTKLIRHFPESEDFDSFQDKLIDMNKRVSLLEWQNYERLKLNMEASGYNYISLLISRIFLTIDHIIDNYGFSNISINEIYFFLIIIVFILFLRKMHFINVKRSHRYLDKLLKYKKILPKGR